jgi:hypothetical protein
MTLDDAAEFVMSNFVYLSIAKHDAARAVIFEGPSMSVFLSA